MEMYKDAVCHELREMLTVWEKHLAYPLTTQATITKMRGKILHLCSILDKIEEREKNQEGY